MSKRKVSRINFTKAAIEALPLPPKGGRAYYYDTKIVHLTLCITGAGRLTYYHYRKVNGRPRRYRIDSYEAISIEKARKRAEVLNGQVAEGGDPQAKKVKQRERDKRSARRLTLQDLFDKYRVEHLVARGKRLKNPDSYWKVYLSPWKDKKLTEIKKADVQALHGEIASKKSGTTANRVYQLLRAMYNFAAYSGVFKGENPAGKIRRYPERSRERFLHPDELPRFFEALAECVPDFRDFILISLLTGARRGNVQAMSWHDLNLERGTWEIPKTKTGEPLTVPLVPEAVTILEARKTHASSEWVFPGRGATGHIVEPKRAWTELIERAGIEDLRLHDLRRTLGSWQAATGASLSVIGKSLGHSNVSTTAVYARLNLDPVRQSLNTATRAMLVAGGVVEAGEVAELGK